MKTKKWGCEFEQLPAHARALAYAKFCGWGAINAALTYFSLRYGVWGVYAPVASVAASIIISRHYRHASANLSPYLESPFNDYFNMLCMLLIGPYCCVFFYLFSCASDSAISLFVDRNRYFLNWILEVPVFRVHSFGAWPPAVSQTVFAIIFLAYSVFLTILPSAANAFDMRDYWVKLFKSDRHPITWLLTIFTSLFMSAFAPGLLNLDFVVRHDDAGYHSWDGQGVLIFLLGGGPALSFWLIFSGLFGYCVFLKRKIQKSSA